MKKTIIILVAVLLVVFSSSMVFSSEDSNGVSQTNAKSDKIDRIMDALSICADLKKQCYETCGAFGSGACFRQCDGSFERCVGIVENLSK